MKRRQLLLDRRLKNHLCNYPPERVERFLSAIKPILLGDAVAPRSALGSPERLDSLRRTLSLAKRLKDSLTPPSSVQAMADSVLGSAVLRNVFDRMKGTRGNVEAAAVEAQKLKHEFTSGSGDLPPLYVAWVQMMPHLNAFIASVEQEIDKRKPTRVGRQSADPNRMLADVARTYADTLEDEPTSTEGGTFYNIAVEILGIRDPQRWVLDAIANYRVTKLPTSR